MIRKRVDSSQVINPYTFVEKLLRQYEHEQSTLNQILLTANHEYHLSSSVGMRHNTFQQRFDIFRNNF